MTLLDKAVLGTLGICACLLAAPAAAESDTSTVPIAPGKKGNAKRDCFDFSALTPGTKYELGDTVKAGHATITIRDYLGTGAPAENRGVWITDTKIAGGTARNCART